MRQFFFRFLVCLILLPAPCIAKTLYMGESELYKTLKQAFQEMEPGDTLIIRDGVYTGPENVIHYGWGGSIEQLPPSGTDGAYTVIRAENEGRVTFDGEGMRRVFYIGAGDFHHIEFHGLKWINHDRDFSANTVQIAGNQTNHPNAHHIKFFRCGAKTQDQTLKQSTWSVSWGEYYLFEECYAWGSGRYGFLVQDQSNGNGAKKVIYRRCVVRLDDVFADDRPIGGFMNYAANEIEYQNCIVLDMDSSYWRTWSYSAAAFSIRRADSGMGPSSNTHYRGCIGLNNLGWTHGVDDKKSYFSGMQIYNPVALASNSVEHCLLWDVMWGIASVSAPENGNATVKNCTIKTAMDPSYPSAQSGSIGIRLKTNWTVKNSIVINHQNYAMRDLISDYNSIYTDGIDFYAGISAGENDFSDDNNNEIDPLEGTPGNGIAALKFLPRIEPGSDLSGTGENGDSRGATISQRYGVSGTLWGEPGYKVLTTVDLWPFPYEDQIKADLASYNPTGGPLGTRGFCRTDMGLYGGPVTLTSYIWEYLGNRCPGDICSNQSVPSPPVGLRISDR